jgi:hypothetical protein
MSDKRREIRDELLRKRERFPLSELAELLAEECGLPQPTIVRILIEALGEGLFDERPPTDDEPVNPADPFSKRPHSPTGWWREPEAEPTHVFGGEMYWDDPLIFEVDPNR